jgi:anti-sigma regulatory factor (Ser/Thr protein kinase)
VQHAPIRSLRVDLPLLPQSPHTARALVTSALIAWGHSDDDLEFAAELTTSELVTNALVHGEGEVVLLVSEDDHGLRIAVRDGSAVVPRLRGSGPFDHNGRGLGVVDALSSDWGVTSHEGGKEVWVLLASK